MSDESEKMCVGKVISVEGDKLTTESREGRQQCHTVRKDAKLTLEGNSCTLEDIKVGTRVRVTPCSEDCTMAAAVDSGKPKSELVKNK
jgi:hypothetical protein